MPDRRARAKDGAVPALHWPARTDDDSAPRDQRDGGGGPVGSDRARKLGVAHLSEQGLGTGDRGDSGDYAAMQRGELGHKVHFGTSQAHASVSPSLIARLSWSMESCPGTSALCSRRQVSLSRAPRR